MMIIVEHSTNFYGTKTFVFSKFVFSNEITKISYVKNDIIAHQYSFSISHKFYLDF